MLGRIYICKFFRYVLSLLLTLIIAIIVALYIVWVIQQEEIFYKYNK